MLFKDLKMFLENVIFFSVEQKHWHTVTKEHVKTKYWI